MVADTSLSGLRVQPALDRLIIVRGKRPIQPRARV
jgi:hypothetical protein